MTQLPDSSGRILTKVEKWSNRYTVGEYSEIYESRFATGELSISAEAFLAEWPTWNVAERLDFVRAFASKWRVTPDDESIIEFLASQPDARIQEMIANMAVKHTNRDWGLQFLLTCAHDARLKRENFLQALGLLRDPRALPSLRSFYEEDMAEAAAASALVSPELARDLVLCCEALENTAGTDTEGPTLNALQQHSDEQIRSVANLRAKIRRGVPKEAEGNDRQRTE